MGNDDVAHARDYHERTKHSVARLRTHPHVLAWDIQPLPYKIYADLAPLPLPRDWPESNVPALEAIAAVPTPGAPRGPRLPTLAGLARLLLLSAGITRKAVYASGRETYFRAAACTGALYHVDLYLVSGALADLEAGVYHFGPHDFALRRLRSGDHRSLVIEASGNEPAVAAAPVIVVCASTYWRNAWKYQARTYRHCFWDAGTILANALAVATDLPAHVVLGFVDRTINELLGLDGTREAALALLALGHGAETPPAPPPASAPLALATVPLSAREVDYPEIRAMHDASSLSSPSEVAAWRAAAAAASVAAAPQGPTITLDPAAAPPRESIDRVIRRRGSTRTFARVPIALADLALVLDRSTRGIPADFLPEPTTHLSELYLIVHAVDGLAPGTYVYHPAERALEPLRAGAMRREAGFLGLGQDLPADASVNCYLLADLGPILARFGNRGYRAAQLEAAITGGKLYLAAYALGLGATGLTFFDDDVVEFFSPRAAATSVMFLAAVGAPRRGGTRG